MRQPSALSLYGRGRVQINESTFPCLARLALRYLSTPATSHASEQLFSAARGIYDYTRTNLDPKKAEMLLFLKKAIPGLGYYY